MKFKLNPFRNSAKLHRTHVLAHQVARDPYTDWSIILSVSTLIALVLMALGLYTYLTMGTRLAAVPKVKTASGSTIDTRTLTRVLGAWADRAREHDELIRGYSGVGDPSI